MSEQEWSRKTKGDSFLWDWGAILWLLCELHLLTSEIYWEPWPHITVSYTNVFQFLKRPHPEICSHPGKNTSHMILINVVMRGGWCFLESRRFRVNIQEQRNSKLTTQPPQRPVYDHVHVYSADIHHPSTVSIGVTGCNQSQHASV